MLKHCVFCHFKSDVAEDRRQEAVSSFATLLQEVDGMIDFAAGPNLDYEAKSPDYSHGFIITFRDRAAHLDYEQHPTHQRLGAELVDLCAGGADGIIVFDLTV